MHLKRVSLISLLVVSILLISGILLLQKRQTSRVLQSATSPAQVSGNMTLHATFESIGIEIKNTSAATGVLEFKKTTEASWRQGLPLWQAGGALYGSALLLTPGTIYDIRVSYDGTIAQGQIATRTDSIPSASTLIPTHFVRVDGNDANIGTSDSPIGAWKTIAAALAKSPENAVIEVGPGYHTVSGKVSTAKRLTLKAKFPALDDNRNEINPDKRSVIEIGAVSGPATSAPYTNVWVPETFTGPSSNKSYTLFRWSNKPVIGKPSYLGYATTRSEMPKRITYVKMKTEWTNAKRAEFLFENDTYSYGWFQSQTDTNTIYLRVPPTAPHVDPNSLFVTMGIGSGLTIQASGQPINGSNFRVSGFEIRGFNSGITFAYPATFGVADHNLIGGVTKGISFNAIRGEPSLYGSDHVVQYNKIIDSNVRAKPGQSSIGMIPWPFVKGETRDTYGASQKRTGEDSETGSIGGTGGARRVIIRNNTFDGTFNGIGTYENNFDKYTSHDMDISNNLFQNIADDAVLEHEPNSINQRIWNNTFEYVSVMATLARGQYGPHYIFRNTVFRLGSNEVPGRQSSPEDRGVGTLLFKMSGAHRVQPIVYFINNTVWSDQTRAKGWQITNSGEGVPPSFYLRNNIIQLTWRLIHDGVRLPNWNEDYNSLTVNGSIPDAGNRWEGINTQLYRTVNDLKEYRVKVGNAVHTNTVDLKDYAFTDNTLVNNMLENPLNGNFNLKQSAQLIDSGTPVPNVADNYDLKSQFLGSAPDLGAIESPFSKEGQSQTPNATLPSPTPTKTSIEVTQAPTITQKASPTPQSQAVDLYKPIDGSTVIAGSRVGLAARAKGASYVIFYVNDSILKVDGTDSFNASWDVPSTPNTSYTLKATAVMPGNQTTTDSLQVYVP